MMDSTRGRTLVVAFPKLSKHDLEWIQAIRKEHDPLSLKAIAPHFTFIPPTLKVDYNVTFSFPPFQFTLRRATVAGPIDGGDILRRVYSTGDALLHS